MPWFNRKVRLKTRFMVATATVLLVLMTTIVLLVGNRFANSVRQEVRERGVAIAHSIAAVSTNALLTYNYVALEQNAEQASRGTGIVYVIILNKEENVAAFSGHPGWQGKRLDDEVNRRALAASESVVQSQLWEETGERVLDITMPVFIPSSRTKWGTVRVGLSLERMYEQIRRTQLVLVGIGGVALVLGLIGAHFMAARITRPLSRVVQATIAAAGGDLNQHLEIRTRDEVEELARNFNAMIREILAQRHQLEEHLEEILQLKRYNDMILASMTNGLISLDLDGRLVSANAAVETAFGLKAKDWQGIHYRDLWPGESPLGRILAQCLLSQTSCRNQEISMATGYEPQRSLIVNTSLLRDTRGVPLGLLVVLNDVTEMKEMEMRIRQADRLAALGTLAAGLAHEIRNPLSAVKTFVQLLPKKMANPGFLEKFHITVPRELNRINSLIESLLELARPPKMEFQAVMPTDLLNQVADLYRNELEETNITLEVQEEGALPELWADGEHLVRAFSNLIMNAKQAMSGGGKLTIKAEALTSGVRLHFIDTGLGLGEATKDNIFNPFFTTKDKGTGLGLAITHKIVQEHHGTIEVSSTRDEGTTFTLTIPGMHS